MLILLAAFLFSTSGYGLIAPMTKSDGSLDVTSLVTHIALLEQRIDRKTPTEETADLKAQLQTAQTQLTVAQTELRTAMNELTLVKSELESTQQEVAVLQFQVRGTNSTESNGYATFTRWGRTACPAGNRIIYKGYTGGTHYRDKASSATILCLPEEPIYATHTSDGHRAYIYGTEYETYSGEAFHNLIDEDMPCVVCESETKRSAIMVPARNQCYQGWELEYWGYLMGPRGDHASGEYICVDKDPEAIPGGHENLDGQALFMVESVCGSLPCLPYKNNWELTCSVCSQ